MVRNDQELVTTYAIDSTHKHSASDAIPGLAIAVPAPDTEYWRKFLDQPPHAERLKILF